ncbi:LOW QUALITY PROTEIN: chromosome (plasmid) partitioning protein ParB [Geomicrobium sp. JCM 19039]|nr:LOW QUALITY PROTEIN: chromosome (plasmid) partitioning protein ParB [Geomicrobium sp. JCM 19039]
MPKGLGRGLNAYFPDESKGDDVQTIALKEMRPNPYQPVKRLMIMPLKSLPSQLMNMGSLQPLLVRKSIKGYDIIAGERRYRAAKHAGLDEVPVIVKTLDDKEMMEIALIENLQREDLNPLEEAMAYEKLQKHLKITQEQLAKKVGKSRPHVANHLRLLQLPEVVQTEISEQRLSMGHGRALLGINHEEQMPEAAYMVIDRQLNVRQTEQLVQEMNERNNKPKRTKEKAKPIFIREQEHLLQTYFGTSVQIKKGKRKGKIEIEFLSDEDLDRILSLLDQQEDGE